MGFKQAIFRMNSSEFIVSPQKKKCKGIGSEKITKIMKITTIGSKVWPRFSKNIVCLLRKKERHFSESLSEWRFLQELQQRTLKEIDLVLLEIRSEKCYRLAVTHDGNQGAVLHLPHF